ncbi:hypothetical protein BU14_2223s0001, partial [Porphyra umbilicalis]
MDGSGLRRRGGGDGGPPGSVAAAAASVDELAAGGGGGGGGSGGGGGPVCGPRSVGTVAVLFVKAAHQVELVATVRRVISAAGVGVEVSDRPDLTILLLTAPLPLLIRTADELALRKRDLRGEVRSFSADSLGEFVLEEDNPSAVGPRSDALFTPAEQILLLEYVLDKVRPDAARFDDIHGNESLLEWCQRQGYVRDVYPLHEGDAVSAIMNSFSRTSPLLDYEALSRMQAYFGDKVALYFSFLTFYTKSLALFGVVGGLVSVGVTLLPQRAAQLQFAFTIFTVLWSVALLSNWKRRNVEIMYLWKKLVLGDAADEAIASASRKEDYRKQFFGELVNHRITGEKIMVYPGRLHAARFAVSALVVTILLGISARVMVWSLHFEDTMQVWRETVAPTMAWSRSYVVKDLIMGQMPLVVYLGCLNLLDRVNGFVAHKLTDFENHKYASTYENALVAKLVAFQFLNMNMAYLFVAFVRRDFVRLHASLRSVMLIELVTGNIKETVLPVYMASRKKAAAVAARDAATKAREEAAAAAASPLPPENDVVLTQAALSPDEGVFGDYFELVRQFSYISLFASAFPVGATVAALNNLGELYADTFKLCRLTRRPSPARALTIGAWMRAFEFISVASIATNLAIIAVTRDAASSVVGGGRSKTEEYFAMVLVEHLLLLVRYVAGSVLEGCPRWVRDARAKEQYQRTKRENSG